MADGQEEQSQQQKNFFISYTEADRRWAEWIAWHLEEAGYSTIIQAWDMRPGSNFIAEMDRAAKCAERTIPVLSVAYLESKFAFSEWAAAFRHDPKGQQGKVLPMRIEQCRVEGLLGSIVYVDLVGLDEQHARSRLLAGVQSGRGKPAHMTFPGGPSPSGPLASPPVFPASLPPIWNVPYPQNPLFTGREELLSRLTASLRSGQPTALSQPQAISGLGGIGKTQLALEYAYRYRGDYQAVFWALADTRENLTSSYLAIALLLDLPEKKEQESARVIEAVKNWLQRNRGWLFVLDNADDLALAHEFLPPVSGGHILLTTRTHTTGGIAHRLEVEVLSEEASALFLLRRADRLAPDALLEQTNEEDRAVALSISRELGGLPLALDQAGAYIEETRCSLADYVLQYRMRRTVLLQRRGGVVPDHPEPVATTWSLSFEKIEQAYPAAAHVLRLCAYLAPDAIPEEIVVVAMDRLASPKDDRKRQKKRGQLFARLFGGREHIPPKEHAFVLDDAIVVGCRYSLLSRDPQTHTLSVHRLVQAVIRDQMREQDRRQ